MNYKRLFINNGLLFITLVTNNRTPILLENMNLLLKSYLNVKKIYKFDLIAYIIQKDHIHCIIKPLNIEQYPKIIKSFKYSFTKNVGLVKPTYNKIWQSRYWEHTIRDENDLYKHLDYIHYNSYKHHNIAPKDWNYSSFKNYVKNGFYEYDWLNFNDKNNILNLDFE